MAGSRSHHHLQWILPDPNVNPKLLSYDTLGAENIPYVLNHTNLTTLFCSKESLDVLLKCANTGSIKNIVCFDNVQEATVETYKEKGITIYSYQDLLTKYKTLDVKVE